MSRSIAMSRRQLFASAAWGAVAAMPAWAARPRWPAIQPPQPPRIPHPITQLGRTRDDQYAWMKYVPANGARSEQNVPEAVRTLLTSENAYADAILAPLAGVRAALLETMLARSAEGGGASPIERGGWAYSAAIPDGAIHAVHVRRREGGVPETLVDEGERARGQAYYRSTDHQPSPDGRYFAWAEDLIGNDRHRIVVRDNAAGAVRVLVEKDAYGYGAVVFSPSSRYLFWIWRDARNRPTRLYRSAVAGGETKLVYEERDPAMFMSVRRTSADGFVALVLSGPETAEVRLIRAEDETAAPAVIWPRRAGIRYDVDEWQGALLATTDLDGALDQKILRLDPRDFRIVDTLVPHRPGVPILTVMPFTSALVRLERADGLHRLVIRHADATEHVVAFPEAAYAIELLPGQDYRAESVLIVHQSPKSPRRWIEVRLADGRQRVLREERVRGFDPANYEVERLFARAPDGETVPVTLLSRRGMPRDGSQPVLLTGYAAYGISSDPEFSIPVTVLVDRGWRVAIAHARGGSEKGRRWFLGGRKFTKRNSFTDFVASAEHLCRERYTARGRVVAYGLSAGGLLVGASMNLAPTLWGGVIAKVPFVDMLNTMSDAEHPLVPLFRPDWGDPLADPKAYDYIASISPYENVWGAPYPPLLCTAGLKDDRVPYWEPAKLVANVRHRSTSGNPALLLTDMHSGHQGSAGLRSDYAEKALFWAFAEHCVG